MESVWRYAFRAWIPAEKREREGAGEGGRRAGEA